MRQNLRTITITDSIDTDMNKGHKKLWSLLFSSQLVCFVPLQKFSTQDSVGIQKDGAKCKNIFASSLISGICCHFVRQKLPQLSSTLPFCTTGRRTTSSLVVRREHVKKLLANCKFLLVHVFRCTTARCTTSTDKVGVAKYLSGITAIFPLPT